MATPSGDIAEPVIASSNRYNDIVPYVKGLFQEDPQMWMQVLPWEFPQNGDKETEEDFLRKFFTDREIRMQGGTDTPDNGFRFLKQVWYGAALWNVEHRLPAIVNWWFEHNQNLVNDPSMKQHLLHNDARPSTFFQAAELKLYGEKLLGWAVRMIQTQLRVADGSPISIHIRDEKSSTVQSEHKNTGPEQLAPPQLRASSGPTAGPATDGSIVAVASPQPSLRSAPLRLPSVMPPVIGSHGQDIFRGRNFSSGSYQSEERLQVRKPRGSYGNRRTSINHSRFDQRTSSQTFGDSRQASYSSSHYGPSAASVGAVSLPGANHLTPNGHFPIPVEHMPPLPHGRQFHGPPPSGAGPIPLMPPHYDQHMSSFQIQDNTPTLPGTQPPFDMPRGPVPGPYLPSNPFADRSNVHINSKRPHRDRQYHVMDDKANLDGPRRDSVFPPRGGKSRGGPGGSGRGRGGRGRGNSSVENHMLYRGAQRETDHGLVPSGEPRLSIQREKTWWRSDGPDESSVDHSLLADEGHHERQIPKGFQMLSRQGDHTHINAPGGLEMPPVQPSERQPLQACPHGCTKDWISETCEDVRKLIVFSVPSGLAQELVFRFFSQFGAVKFISDLRAPSFVASSQIPSTNTKYFMWVTFEDSFGARNCLASKGMQWPGGLLSVEVAKEHCEPFQNQHVQRQQRSGPAYTGHDGIIFEPPTRGLPPRPEPQQGMVHVQQAFESGLGTSKSTDLLTTSSTYTENLGTPSNSASDDLRSTTPKKKQPKQGKKKAGKRRGELTDSELNGKDRDAEAPSKDLGPSEIVTVDESPTRGAGDDTKTPDDIDSADPPATPMFRTGNDGKAVTEAGLVEDDKDEVVTKAALESSEEDDKVDVVLESGLDPALEELRSPDAHGRHQFEPKAAIDSIERPAPTTKQDDDQNEDSFHTASGFPEAEQEKALEGDEINASDTTSTLFDGVDQLRKPTTRESDVASTHSGDSDISKMTVKDLLPSTGMKKVPVPQMPSPKSVAATLLSIDTHKAQAVDQAECDFLQVPAQRTTSGNSEATTAAFVTAPNTPAVPAPASEPKSKKLSKLKGPEQTESFSIFAKPKANRKASKTKKATPKRKGSSLDTSSIPELKNNLFDGNGTPVTSKEHRSSENQEKRTDACPTPPQSRQEKAELPRQQESDPRAGDSIEADLRGTSGGVNNDFNSDASGSGMPFGKAVSEVSSGSTPQQPQLQLHNVVENAALDDQELEVAPKVVVEESVDQRKTISTHADVSSSTSDIHGEEAANGDVPEDQARDGPSSKSKKKKKKSGKKRAMAEVTEMSLPGVDNHMSRATFEVSGNDAGSDVSSSQTIENEEIYIASPTGAINHQVKASPEQTTQARRNQLAAGSNVSNGIDRPATAVESSKPRRRMNMNANNVSTTDSSPAFIVLLFPDSGNEEEQEIKKSRILEIGPDGAHDPVSPVKDHQVVEMGPEGAYNPAPVEDHQVVASGKENLARLQEQEKLRKEAKNKEKEQAQ